MRWFWQREKKARREPHVPEGVIRRRLRYTGSVQAVGFRFTAESWARGRGVTGWVTNLLDGDVMLEVQGTSAQVEGFLSDVATESQRAGAFIHATLIQCDELDPVPEERFVIRNVNF